MRHILVIESHADLAEAFEHVLASARFDPIVRRCVESLADVDVTPSAIVARIGHADLSGLPASRPPVVAIASNADDVAEARRLKCEVVLKAPEEIRQLCEALARLTGG